MARPIPSMFVFCLCLTIVASSSVGECSSQTSDPTALLQQAHIEVVQAEQEVEQVPQKPRVAVRCEQDFRNAVLGASGRSMTRSSSGRSPKSSSGASSSSSRRFAISRGSSGASSGRFPRVPASGASGTSSGASSTSSSSGRGGRSRGGRHGGRRGGTLSRGGRRGGRRAANRNSIRASAPSPGTSSTPSRTSGASFGKSLAQVERTCVNPSTDDPESWACDCAAAMEAQCGGVDEDCFKGLMCSHSGICMSWKRSNCQSLLEISDTEALDARARKNQDSTDGVLDGSLSGKCGSNEVLLSKGATELLSEGPQ